MQSARQLWYMVFDGKDIGLTVQLEEDPSRWGPLVGATEPGIAL